MGRDIIVNFIQVPTDNANYNNASFLIFTTNRFLSHSTVSSSCAFYAVGCGFDSYPKHTYCVIYIYIFSGSRCYNVLHHHLPALKLKREPASLNWKEYLK